MYSRNCKTEEKCRIRRMIGLGIVVALLWIALFVLFAVAAVAVVPQDIPARLRNMADCKVLAAVEVTLPMAADDRDQIDYGIVALSRAAGSDTLLPVDYLVEWTLPSPEGTVSKGFTSYFAGHLYRFRDSRLREYHFDDNPDPFLSADGGVQRSTQFMDVLPYFLADEIERIISDSTYTVTWNENVSVDGLPASVLRADQEINGEIVGELTYVFDTETMVLRRIVREMSPGTISEQTVTVRYSVPGGDVVSRDVPVTEDEVMEIYPDVFTRFREKNYRLTSLPGQPVPEIALQSASGSRYTHPRGEKFAVPTVIAFVDENVSTTPDAAKAVRNAVASLPFTSDIVWVFMSSRPDDVVDAIPGGVQQGETLLYGGRNVIREFGVTETPSIVIAGQTGRVVDVVVGYNKDLESDVIKKVALAR